MKIKWSLLVLCGSLALYPQLAYLPSEDIPALPEIQIPPPPGVSPTARISCTEGQVVEVSDDLVATRVDGCLVLIRGERIHVSGCEFVDARLLIEEAAEVTVEDSVFRDRYRLEESAINVYGAQSVSLRHNLVWNNFIGIGVHESRDVEICENHFRDNDGHNAITFDLGSMGKIHHNYFYNSFPHAILVGAGAPDGSVEIYQNRIEYSVEDAIDFEHFSSQAPSRVYQNVILHTGWAGIVVEYGSWEANLSLDDNYIAFCGTSLEEFPQHEHQPEPYSTGWKHGILLEDCSGVTLHGNTVVSNVGNGIQLINARGITLEGNVVHDNAIGICLENYREGSLTRPLFPLAPEDANGSQARARDNHVSGNRERDWYVEEGSELVIISEG